MREMQAGERKKGRKRERAEAGDDASNVSAFARAACVAIESSSGKMAAKGKARGSCERARGREKE